MISLSCFVTGVFSGLLFLNKVHLKQIKSLYVFLCSFGASTLVLQTSYFGDEFYV